MRDATDAERELLWRAVVDVRRTAGVGVAFGGLVTDGCLRLTEFDGARTAALRGLAVRRGAGLGGRVVATARPALVRDYAVERGISHDYDGPVGAEGLRSVLAVPVLISGEVNGVLYGAVRQPEPIGDRGTRLVIGAATRLARELSIRREVDRRVAQAEREREAVSRMAELERLRAAHARLRALAAGADAALRDELDGISQLLVDPAVGAGGAGEVVLTPREVDALALVAVGCSNAEAARRLGVGIETVKSHLRSASRKLGAQSRVDAVVAARRLGLLP